MDTDLSSPKARAVLAGLLAVYLVVLPWLLAIGSEVGFAHYDSLLDLAAVQDLEAHRSPRPPTSVRSNEFRQQYARRAACGYADELLAPTPREQGRLGLVYQPQDAICVLVQGLARRSGLL